jgi:S1-C subfamily serine protease
MVERMAPLMERGSVRPGQFSFMFSRGSLHLEDLNKDLGEYFGTSDGVLVLETPKDSTSPFRAGDVIISIDGRKPNDAAHAHRILGSYERGESAEVEIMRKQRRMTVTWQAPEPRGMLRRTPAPERTRMREPVRPMRRMERT